ncbi:hypothetical protein [Acidithrix sp. C25]|nr:hypothetical protein [Acidithrix sp. C25]CAG4924922.1 unnamed protein product [Acidithrix sp. C25]
MMLNGDILFGVVKGLLADWQWPISISSLLAHARPDVIFLRALKIGYSNPKQSDLAITFSKAGLVDIK